jgi:hypothetical protein
MSLAPADQAKNSNIVAVRFHCIELDKTQATRSTPPHQTASKHRISAEQFFADPPLATEPLRRAAETDREVASLLSEHPRNVDDAILLVRLCE